MALNFNAEPYYDDFDEDKKFYRVLFRPGYAVQARELTQLQTILQQQVTRFGNHVFKEGSMVIPGQISIDTDIGYVKLQATYGSNTVSAFLSNLEGEVIVGQTSGVRALVTKTAVATSTDPNTLMVKYLDSGTSNTSKVFTDNEVIAPETASASYTVQAVASSATGKGSIAEIKRGIYYVKGTFALVTDQSLILDKYSNTPSYRVGLTIAESFVDSDDDQTLLDNAQGSYNFAAPGADRYKIDLTLAKLTLVSTADTTFLELARVSSGTVQQKTGVTEYSVLEETLARRTFDESGNYTVSPFKLDVREHRNNNRGTWITGRAYLANDIVVYSGNYYVARTAGTSGSTAPTHTVGEATDGAGGVTWLYESNPQFNRGIYDALDATTPGDATKLAVGLEPGKAYVRGYEIDKIATEYLEIDKARDYEDVSNNKIEAKVGNYVLVSNVHQAPRIDTFATINLYDELNASAGSSNGTLVGTARARFLEFESGTIGDSAAIYKLSLFDIQMNSGYDFNKNVKQFYYNGGTAATSFTADISPVQTILRGSVTASASTTLTGTATLFESELVVGDYIYIGDSSTVREVTAVNSNTEIEVDSNVTATGAVVYKLTTQVLEPNNTPLLFPFPYEYIREARDSGGANAISYTVMERFTGTSDGSGILTLSVGGGNDTFASEAENSNYIVVRNDTGAVILPSSISRLSANTQVQINTGVNNTAMVVLAAVQKTGSGTEKTKTLTTVTSLTKTTAATATLKEITLGKADGYKLLHVKMDTGTFGSPTGTYSIDITDRYNFDDGQRLTYYDLAKIILKDGDLPPIAPIEIAFQYFAHSGSGDYFTVNSYLSTVPYENVPNYLGLNLTDLVDFRPRIDDDGVDFTTTGSSVSLIPKRGNDIEADFSYYLSRQEKIALDFDGNFFNISGTSALNPAEPNDPSIGMVLYKLNLQPYTLSTKQEDIGVQTIDNKRYTMRDIGRIEKRVDNLEYYTSLSLLETETQALIIPDADTGLDRFKNGFFVDNFRSQIAGDPNSPDWNASIDLDNGILRPFYSMNNINMIELNTLDADRTTDGYQVTGDLITLPYTHTEIINQPYASRLENINPFAIFTFLGRTDLNPESDDWIEVDRRPDIVQDVEGNYTAVALAAEASGVLGTAWNAWQNVWSGVPVSQGIRTFNQSAGRARLNELFGNKKGHGNWSLRRVVAETFATEVGQSRTGIETKVVATIDRQLVEDRVLSTAIIPYIRSRNILFSTHGLKPETQFYPFFDGTAITDYITPATRVEFTEVSGFGSDFDPDVNAGGDSAETARQINSNSEVALNKGDVVYVGTRSATNYTKTTSPAYGIVVGQEEIDSTLAVYVVNITGTFQANDIIVGSISGARGEVSSTVTNKVAGDDLVTNAAGDLYGLFDLPSTNAIRFRTGSREFRLIDDVNNDATLATSNSRATYRAKGVLETRQATYNAVRNAEIVQEAVTATRTINQTTQRVISDTGWYDPLAQSFLVQQDGGAFLTKVDIYFATKDANIPVQLQIREMVNGYPGKNILPFSRVFKQPNEVNLSSTNVTLDAGGISGSYPAPDTATTFTFPSPVYVEDGKEYCICLVSDSNNYRAWISQLGEVNIGTGRFISEQPYAGVLFKSQNASTWTADQTQDLMFKIYRAEFTTDTYGEVEFVNDKVPTKLLEVDPIQTISGSGVVRIFHKGHGMTVGDTVTLSGATATNGITTGQLNTSQTIDSVEVDSYVVTTAGTATSTGYGGGDAVYATTNYPYQVIQPSLLYQNFSETTFELLAETTTGTSTNGTETAYSQSSYFDVVPNDNNYLLTNRIVASQDNEDANLSSDKSLKLKARLFSTNNSLSPVIDMDRMSAILINNKINNPTLANINNSTLDIRSIVASNTNVAFTAATDTISSADSSTQDLLKTVSVGKYITVTGSSVSANNDTWLVTAVDSSNGTITVDGSLSDDPAGDSVTITIADHFADEISPLGSSSYSKYVSRKINLNNPSTFIRIRLAVDLPPNAGLDVYYRTSPVGSDVDFATQKYTLVSPDTAIQQTNDALFFDVDYTLTDLEPFDALSLKLVFTSTNSANVARVKDLRVIACA